MTDISTVTTPQPGADAGNAPAARSPTREGAIDHAAFDRLDPQAQSAYAQVKRADGDGGEYVRRDSLPPDTSDKPGDKADPKTAQAPEAAKTDGGKYRFGTLELSDQEIADLVAHKAAADARKLSAPQSPQEYEAKLSPNFKLPEGTEFKLDEADPLWAQAKTWAHKNGLSQEAFAEAIDLVAGRDLITHEKVRAAQNGEIAKLGTTGPARIDAIERFYTGLLGSTPEAKAVMSRIFTASDVKLHEKVIARFSNQGAASFTQQHRVPADGERVSDEQYDRMSHGERMAYARSHDQKQFGSR